jgi:hypothetical protein
MGQAKQRKAEIEQLKAGNDTPTMGLTFVFKDKAFDQEKDVYATFSIRANKHMVKEAVSECQRIGMSKNDLYTAARELFIKDGDKIGKAEHRDYLNRYAWVLLAYSQTFKTIHQFGDHQYQMGHVFSVLESDPGNPNGAIHGSNRFAYSIPYPKWLEQVSATEADPIKLRQVYDHLFAQNDFIRISGRMLQA